MQEVGSSGTERVARVAAPRTQVALGRVLDSPEFRSSARMSELLRYLVEATLNGRAAELKEIVVGVEVFGREPGYDPKTDSTVRKEVRRLRLKLAEYYSGSGASDEIRFDIPKGSYVAVITEEAPPEVTPTETAPARRWSISRAWRIGMAAALLVTCVSAVAWRDWSKDTPSVPGAPRPLTGNNGYERHPVFSPDGTKVAFTWQAATDRKPGVYVHEIGGDVPQLLTDASTAAFYPSWSPDGKRLAYLAQLDDAGYEIRVRGAVPGDAEQVVTTVSRPDHIEWSHDGASILVADRASPDQPAAIVRISLAGGGRRQVTFPSAGTAGDAWPVLSPDGGALAFLRSQDPNLAEIWVQGTADTRARQVTNEKRSISGIAWAANGKDVVASLARGNGGTALWRIDTSSGRLDRVTAAGWDARWPATSPRGERLGFVRYTRDMNVWKKPLNPDGPVSLAVDANALDTSAQISPADGSIAYRSDRSGTNEIWITHAREMKPRRLTRFDGPLTGSPSWSPDGKWVAFDSRAGGTSDIYVVSSAGGEPGRLTQTNSSDIIPRWSRDGEWIYFASDRSGKWQVWRQNFGTGAAEQVTWRGGFAGQQSYDGRYLYYTRSLEEPGLFRIHLAGGEEETVLPDLRSNAWVNWALGRNSVYYLQADKATYSIQYLDFGSNQTRLVHTYVRHPVLWDGGLAVAPDESYLLFAQLDKSDQTIQVIGNFR